MEQGLVFYPNKKDLAQIPRESGVYKMLAKDDSILYVGKAKFLRNRVRSYFSVDPHPDLKTRFLVSHICKIEIIVTSTEHHALILENQLIKTFRPRYNIALKDDKQYPYLKITNELYPRVLMVRDRKKDGAMYFGPYASFGSAKVLLKHIHDLFPFRDCKQSIDAVSIQPKCINLDIGKCLGPCVIKDDVSAYQKLVDELTLLLTGKNKQLLKDLKTLMTMASDARAYEKAAIYRDRFQKLFRLVDQKIVMVTEGEDCQVWVCVESDGICYILVQTFLNGILMYQRGVYQYFDSGDLDSFCIESFFSVLESSDSLPTELILSKTMSDVLAPVLKDMSVVVNVPKKGEKRAWVDLAERNGHLSILRLLSQDYTKSRDLNTKANLNLCEEIRAYFSFSKPIRSIFGFDISHLSGQDIVASAVSFYDGIPNKSLYRRFTIRGVSQDSNDPLSMYEVVKRRLMLCEIEGEALPDLILVDGGKGQLNFAFKALKELKLENFVELLSLAKQEEEIYSYGKKTSTRFSRQHSILKCFQRVRDESHRFANSYQRVLRKKGLKSVLLSIEGLGVKRVNALYQEYKTLDNIEKTPVEELALIGKMGKRLATRVHQALKL